LARRILEVTIEAAIPRKTGGKDLHKEDNFPDVFGVYHFSPIGAQQVPSFKQTVTTTPQQIHTQRFVQLDTVQIFL